MATTWTQIGTGTQALVSIPFDNGSVDGDQYPSLNAAITAIGVSSKTLVLTTQKSLTASVTIPSTLQIVFKQGGGVNLAGYILTWNQQPIIAGDYQIFFNAIANSVLGLKEINPKWFGTLNTTITVVSTNPTFIKLNYAETLTANLTIPATCKLEITPDGSITKASIYTLTINGSFFAGLYQTFIGFSAGDVTGLKEAKPEWWGAVADGTTNNTTAFANAVAATNNIQLQAGKYKGNFDLSNKTGFTLRGAGSGNALNKGTWVITNSATDPVILMNSNSVQIEKAEVSDMMLDGNSQVYTLSVTATNPYVVTKSLFKNLYLINATRALNISGSSSAGEVYGNTFERITIYNCSTRGIEQVNAVYNKFRDIEVTHVGNGAYALNDNGLHSRWDSVAVDGVINAAGQNTIWSDVTIETIFGTPPTTTAFKIVGYKQHIRGLTFTEVANTKCSVGLEVSNDGHVILGVRVMGANYPQQPVLLNSGSSGIFLGFDSDGLAGNFAIDNITAAAVRKNWKIIGDDNQFTKDEFVLGTLVSTATTILDITSFGLTAAPKLRSGLYIVQGTRQNPADNTVGFTDLILVAATANAQTVTALSSQTINGAANRTYSISGTNLQLALAANTYMVTLTGLSLAGVNN